MKTYKELINEVKQSVAKWQAGVRSSQLAGNPDYESLKDPNFQAGFKTGMKKGPKAADPSYRAKAVEQQRKAMVKSGSIEEETLLEKNIPTNPELWSKAKTKAKAKFEVYPSAYANGWAAKWYKQQGGGWKKSGDSE
jgi:hypothetical protein